MDPALIARLAADLTAADFAQVLGRWVELVDDQAPPDDAKRRFSSADTYGGSAHTDLFGPADDAAIIRAGSLSGDLLDATLSLYENFRDILRLILDLNKPGQYGDWVEDYREKSAGLLVECSSLRESCRGFILDEKQKSAL